MKGKDDPIAVFEPPSAYKHVKILTSGTLNKGKGVGHVEGHLLPATYKQDVRIGYRAAFVYDPITGPIFNTSELPTRSDMKSKRTGEGQGRTDCRVRAAECWRGPSG